MTRFIQQQIPPVTERSVPKAPCPSCPAHVLNMIESEPKGETRNNPTNTTIKKKKNESGRNEKGV